jgi:alanyl-tRNA synthetase
MHGLYARYCPLDTGSTAVSRTAAQVRQEFIDFFSDKVRRHTSVPSSPVVPHDDPTLLFANAGMNQFKPLFLGTADPNSELGRLKRAANTQKCIRAGGKHNDLDDVGHDTYHHTFFEMLGNWSFGDYFKTEAIQWAWELLVERWGLDPERLHATYFEGDASEGLEPDDEARELWLKILPPERVHPGNKKDNFWEMGDTGPCGPCSEVHIDLTPDKTGGALVNAGDARAIEIWNLVFIQFNRDAAGKLTPLPARHVDTGMGFERVTAVLQGHNNNYATDVFVPIIQRLEEMTGLRYGEEGTEARRHGGTKGEEGAAADALSPAHLNTLSPRRYAAMRAGNMQDEACRVIADHVRCLTFALTDGAVPDREGRGYVLRRILRRGVRFGWQYLNLHEPFICELVDTVVDTMGDAFPELRKNPQQVKEIIREEEESFEATLERGIALFEEAARRASHHHHKEIRGEDAFKLHDTYGFPIDLTQVMADEKGLRVDIGEYERLMEEARERARAGTGAGRTGFQPDSVATDPGVTTDDHPKHTSEQLTCTLKAIIITDDAPHPVITDDTPIKPGTNAALIFDRTCFYAEAGGQVGDKGEITAAAGDSVRFDIENTLQYRGAVAHVGTLVQGEMVCGREYELAVDTKRRATMKNHTGTHVLNWALREVLGDHVQQKGSLVDHEKTRFDFSHPKALTPEEIERVEQLANDVIARNLPIDFKVVPQEEALKINGLRAVFGERYPDQVRVMCIGKPIDALLANPDNPEWRQYSIEFCGGTHLDCTGEIEHFVITHEEAVAKGIRRIVAMTGPTAALIEDSGAALVARAEQLLGGPPEDVPEGLTEIQNTLPTATLPARHRIRLNELIAQLQKTAKKQQKADAADAAADVRDRIQPLIDGATKSGETSVVVGEMHDVTVDQLKTGADIVKQKCGSAAVLLALASDGKAILLAAMTPDLVKNGVKAGDLVKAVAPLVKGGGGGPPTMAQAGGKDPAGIPAALQAARDWLAERL